MGCVSSNEEKGHPLPKKQPDSANNTNHVNSINHNDSVSHEDDYIKDSYKDILKETWAPIATQDMQEPGSKVFLKIFQLKPETQKVFHFEQMTEEELRANTKFKIHSTRFMQVVARTIENLDHLDVVLTPLLLQLGRTHASPDKPANFTDYLETFVIAMDFVWRDLVGEAYKGKVQEAWLCLFGLIANTVKDGHKSAVSENEKGKDDNNKI